MGKPRLWRVDAIHEDGYHAPHSLIETDTDRECKAEAEALKLAKQNSRLSKFKTWSFIAINLHRRKLNGKWYTESEYNFKVGK